MDNMLTTKRSKIGTAILIYGAIILIFMGSKLFPGVGLALGTHDTRGLFVPWLSTARQAILSGKLPLWDAYQFAGNPFLSNPQIALFYPPTWLAIILPVNIGISWHVAFHLLLAAVGMFLFVRYMSKNYSGAFIAGLIFAFSGYAVARIWAGHIGLLATNAWLPWILLGTAWAVNRRTVWSAILAGVPWGMAILAGHTTSLVYLGLIWLGLLLFLAVTTNSWLLIARQALLIFAVGLGLSSVQLLPFLQLSQNVARSAASSFEFATAFSLPPEQLMALVVPDYFGDPVLGYWGAPYFEELTFYAGILTLLGFILIFGRPSKRYWFYLAVAALGIILALGSNTPIYKIIYELVPPLRLLRGPGRAGILFVFAGAAVLGELFTTRNLSRRNGEGKRAGFWLRVILTAVLLISVIGAIYTAILLTNSTSAEISAQIQIRLTAIIRATILAFSGICLIWIITRHSVSLRNRFIATALLALLILIDLWGFGYKLVKLEPSGPHPMWQDAKEIIGDSEARVLPWGVNIFDQNGAGQVGLKSVFGYNTLEPEATIALAASQPDPRSQAYDVLSIGYVLTTVPQEHYVDGDWPLQLIGNTDNVWVYERSRILPHARLVNQFEVIPETDRALDRINQPDFDPANNRYP